MSKQSVYTESGAVGIRRAAKALITAGDRILLVKERHEDGTPFWTLPGGGLEPDESETQALKREVAEELRCRVDVLERETSVLYAHSSSERLSQYVVYRCRLATTPTPNLADGILDYQLVKPGEITPSTLPQVRYLCDTLDRVPSPS